MCKHLVETERLQLATCRRVACWICKATRALTQAQACANTHARVHASTHAIIRARTHTYTEIRNTFLLFNGQPWFLRLHVMLCVRCLSCWSKYQTSTVHKVHTISVQCECFITFHSCVPMHYLEMPVLVLDSFMLTKHTNTLYMFNLAYYWSGINLILDT